MLFKQNKKTVCLNIQFLNNMGHRHKFMVQTEAQIYGIWLQV